MAHSISLLVVLAGVWLVLSGHYTGLLLTFGALSCLFVILIARRMDVIDHESHPIHLGLFLPLYWVWLVKEMVKANLDVTRRVLGRRLDISPELFTVPMTQSTDLGKVIYANSITLTPGTVSIDVEDGQIRVHALSREGADQVRGGEMDRRVTALETR